MLQQLVIQLALAWACTVLVAAASGSQDAALQAFGKDGQHEEWPWSPPQWWWLSNVLSFSRGHLHGQASASPGTTALSTQDQQTSPLSVLLPLEGAGEGDKVKEEAWRVGKRSRVCRSGEKGACVTGLISFTEVWQGWKDDYLSVPQAMVKFSQEQAGDNVCKDLSVQLFSVDLREHHIEPLWVRETVYIGMCPSRLQTRHLGDNVWPPKVVETKCLCQRQSCSNLGGDFLCQAVRRPVTVWLRRDKTFLPSQEMLSVGCVCVQRISTQGRYADPGLSS